MVNLNNIKILNNSETLAEPGEYGVHDGFFNTIVKKGGESFYIQCCMEEAEVYEENTEDWNFKSFDFESSGYDESICKEINQPLAYVIGWENIPAVLKLAANNFYYFTK